MARIVAPAHLTPRSRRLYREIVDAYGLEDEGHAKETLRLALQALDRADEARRILDEEGLTYVNRFGEPRAHPMCAVEKDARLAAWRGFRELSLDGSDFSESHMPRIGGARS